MTKERFVIVFPAHEAELFAQESRRHAAGGHRRLDHDRPRPAHRVDQGRCHVPSGQTDDPRGEDLAERGLSALGPIPAAGQRPARGIQRQGRLLAMDVDIERFLWKKRLLLIFSPERADPLFNSLVNEISSRRGDVEDRDLVIFEILESGASKMNSSELEPQKAASFRERFEIPETTFTVILLGKDGGIKLKRKVHVRLEEIFRLIDAMPMRQDEMRQKGRKF